MTRAFTIVLIIAIVEAALIAIGAYLYIHAPDAGSEADFVALQSEIEARTAWELSELSADQAVELAELISKFALDYDAALADQAALEADLASTRAARVADAQTNDKRLAELVAEIAGVEAVDIVVTAETVVMPRDAALSIIDEVLRLRGALNLAEGTADLRVMEAEQAVVVSMTERVQGFEYDLRVAKGRERLLIAQRDRAQRQLAEARGTSRKDKIVWFLIGDAAGTLITGAVIVAADLASNGRLDWK